MCANITIDNGNNNSHFDAEPADQDILFMVESNDELLHYAIAPIEAKILFLAFFGQEKIVAESGK